MLSLLPLIRDSRPLIEESNMNKNTNECETPRGATSRTVKHNLGLSSPGMSFAPTWATFGNYVLTLYQNTMQTGETGTICLLDCYWKNHMLRAGGRGGRRSCRWQVPTQICFIDWRKKWQAALPPPPPPAVPSLQGAFCSKIETINLVNVPANWRKMGKRFWRGCDLSLLYKVVYLPPQNATEKCH